MNTAFGSSSLSGRSHFRKLVVGLFAGAACGAIVVAAILGASAWLNESSNGVDEQSRWAFVGVLIGARLGLIIGAVLGAVIGSVAPASRRYK